MDEICRLCCSSNFVNNLIFDEENALYLKMSLYLPIKVFKDDRLPQKICDKCSCKVNDFYQFCNETIEVQNRLRSVLGAAEAGVSVDLTLVKHDTSTPPPLLHVRCDQGTQTDLTEEKTEPADVTIVKVKDEPKALSPSPVKNEDSRPDDDDHFDVANNVQSESSDDMSLLKLRKKKKKMATNGTNESKRNKRKDKLQDWDLMMGAMSEDAELENKKEVTEEPARRTRRWARSEAEVEETESEDRVNIKSEPMDIDLYHCCICFAQCFGKTETLQHYKQHARQAEAQGEAPAAPPPPDQPPLRCLRCSKVVERGQWAAHWRRHWERDARPYRCALCEKTFRDHNQIFKHALSHAAGEGAAPQPPDKRFICDLCPEQFVYMRYLLAHRTRAHPEAAARALALRCAHCGRSFAHLNSLRRHLRAHSGRRDHLCNVCGKALSSREHLKFHIRIHTGYKPNVCKTCGKGFVKKCNLTLHERTHSGEKPHVCSHCGKAFSQRSTLVIHERYHSGARPYVCSLCQRGFVAKGLLSVHLRSTCI